MKGLFLGIFKVSGWGNYFLIFILAMVSFFYINKSNPPLSSPDEHYHIVRADTLSRGEFILGHEGDRATGTEIDSSYIEFMKLFNMLGFDKTHTSMQAQIDNAKLLYWSDSKTYLESANVAIYFPAIYLPQSVAIAVGKMSGMSIYNTYMLARLLTFSLTIAIIIFAWKIHRIPSLAIAILALPMSVFQFFAASIDGEIIAITVLIMSLYASLISKNETGRSWRAILIYLLIFIVGTCKANLAALLIIPFSLAFIRKDKKHILYSIITASLIIGWTALAVMGIRDAGGQHGGLSNGQVLSYYLHHPVEMMSVILGTMTDPFFIKSYAHQFVGVLGWLDIPIPEWCFRLYFLAILAVALTSLLSVGAWKIKTPGVAMFLAFSASVFLIFFALLIQFSPLPAIRVIGIQGRYFIMPAIVLSYLFYKAPAKREITVIIVAMLIISVLMIKELIFTHYF